MASSQVKSEEVLKEAGAGAFPFAWRSPVISGSETVITNLRPESQVAVREPAEKDQPADLLRRLFPTGADTDDALGICLGHFTIQRRIGIGGMGSVYLAMDDRLRRNVALKVLSPTLTSDPAAVQRFQNEARAAARLDHDNIARIYYYGEDSGLHYIAYEYIPGSNLRDVIRSKDRLAPAEAVNYTMQLAAALSHTAAAGVIHRDIKPSNVLITPQGRAKLVDLGLARKESVDNSVDLTVAGTTLGTFDYISPEQAKDPRNVDVRSDIYSLGCTLYHMLTGEPPYPEGTVLQKLLDHQGKDAPDPARKNRRVPPALSIIVRKMMASDPRRRYPTPAKLLSDLLLIARQLGTGAVPIDGQVWLTATQSERPQWQGNIAWISTAAVLLLLVIAMEQFPVLSHQLDPRAKTPLAIGTPTATKPSNPSATAEVTNPKPSADNGWTASSKSAVPPQSLAARTPSDAARIEGPSARSLFEELQFPSVSASVSGEMEDVVGVGIVKTPATVPVVASTNTEPAVEPTAPTRPNAGPTAPPSVTNTQPDGRHVIISITDGKASAYPTLEAACSEAKDGSIIELRYNGRRREPERPFRLSKKDITIQNGFGFRPHLEFAPDVSNADAAQITVTGGSLKLSGIDVTLTIPERLTADRWALFKLERPKDLRLQGVTVTVVNPRSQPACVIEQVAAPGQGVGNLGMMKNETPSTPPTVSIIESVFRGSCDFIMLRDAVPVRFELENAALALQGVLLRAICQNEVTTSENNAVELDLDRTTCVTAEGLILTEGIDNLAGHAPSLNVTARNNIFWCSANRPLIAMIDARDLMEMQRRFTWTGDRNHYDSIPVFWQLGGRQGPSSARQLDFQEWRSYWGSSEGAGSVNVPVLWNIKPTDRIWAKTEITSLELDPVLNMASDTRGAVLKKLPSLPTELEFDEVE